MRLVAILTSLSEVPQAISADSRTSPIRISLFARYSHKFPGANSSFFWKHFLGLGQLQIEFLPLAGSKTQVLSPLTLSQRFQALRAPGSSNLREPEPGEFRKLSPASSI